MEDLEALELSLPACSSCSTGAVTTETRRHAAVQPARQLFYRRCQFLPECRQLFSRLSHIASCPPGAVLPALAVLKVLYVDELVNVEEIHLAAHLARTVH
jgi:hypothetical protein